jgi:hypothetical protein
VPKFRSPLRATFAALKLVSTILTIMGRSVADLEL